MNQFYLLLRRIEIILLIIYMHYNLTLCVGVSMWCLPCLLFFVSIHNMHPYAKHDGIVWRSVCIFLPAARISIPYHSTESVACAHIASIQIKQEKFIYNHDSFLRIVRPMARYAHEIRRYMSFRTHYWICKERVLYVPYGIYYFLIIKH